MQMDTPTAPPPDLMNATVVLTFAGVPIASRPDYVYVQLDGDAVGYPVHRDEFRKFGSEPVDRMRCRVQFHRQDEIYLIATQDPNRDLSRRS